MVLIRCDSYSVADARHADEVAKFIRKKVSYRTIQRVCKKEAMKTRTATTVKTARRIRVLIERDVYLRLKVLSGEPLLTPIAYIIRRNPMARVDFREEVLNVALAQLLEQRGMLSVPETIRKSIARKTRDLPDILVGDLLGVRIVIEGRFDNGRGSRESYRSMGSIKRDVKKKLLPRPESRCFLEIQPAVIRLPWRSLPCAHSDKSPQVS